MKPTSRLLISAVILSSAFASGCRPKPTTTGKVEPYLGPTQPMSEVVAAINANNAGLPTLWARHYFEATVIDEKRQSHTANGDGILLYSSPRGMRLVGNKDIAGTIFEIGSTDDRYWLKLVPDVDTMWWGWYRNLGRPCVDLGAMPIRPDLMLEVLGVSTIPTNFLATPAPVMRFNSVNRAYMFVWSVPLRDRWAAQKEIWYDLETKLPRLVLLFDENGREVVRAKLSKHAPVELPDVPAERWPKVARLYEIFFPETGSSIRFELDEVAPEHKGVPARPGSIKFPEDPNVANVIQLDRDCTD
jgi:hypothetical protein